MILRSKAFWLTLVFTYLYISILNFIGHAFIISPFIAPGMTAIHADFSKFRLPFLMVTWLLITICTVYFTVRDIPKEDKLKHAIITGILVSVLADGTWVFTNTAFVPAIQSIQFILAELTWHTIHGAGGGYLALKSYEWAAKKWK